MRTNSPRSTCTVGPAQSTATLRLHDAGATWVTSHGNVRIGHSELRCAALPSTGSRLSQTELIGAAAGVGLAVVAARGPLASLASLFDWLQRDVRQQLWDL